MADRRHSAGQVLKHLSSTSAETWPAGCTGPGMPPQKQAEPQRKKTETREELTQWGTPQAQAHCRTPQGAFTPEDRLPKAACLSVVSELSGTPTHLDPDKADSPEWHLCSLKSGNHSRLGSCHCFPGSQDPGAPHRTERSLEGIDSAAQRMPAAQVSGRC